MGFSSVRKFISQNKIIMERWDYDANTVAGLDPSMITEGSNKKAYFICPICFTKWQAIIKNVVKYNGGCPNCANNKRQHSNVKTKAQGKRVLSETHPHLATEWVVCESEHINPNNVVAGSNLKVLWKCPVCSGEYYAIIANRTKRGSGCPYCSGQKVLVGYNDLQTTNPILADEWGEKNTILPNQITAGSNKKVYWQCPIGHSEYLCSPKSRTAGVGCPVCAQQLQTSFPEQAIFFYVKKLYPSAINRYVYNANRNEIDIYIPEQKIGIEYNGYYSHKNKVAQDIKKKQDLQRDGITLLTISEYKDSKDDFLGVADYLIQENPNNSTLEQLVVNILQYLDENNNIEVNISKDHFKISELYLKTKKANSIAQIAPALLCEWDYEKNEGIKPEYISANSNQKCYWVCRICGTSYRTTPKIKMKGVSCPVCTHKRLVAGVNDLKTLYPNLADEWDYSLNNQPPEEVYCGGTAKYYWKCSQGHSYLATIHNRLRGQGCSYCVGKQVLSGFNDLESRCPSFVEDWDNNKNATTPDKVHYNSSKKAFWKCHICGYEWTSAIKLKKQCPQCKKNKYLVNVYEVHSGKRIMQCASVMDVCKKLRLNYNSQHGNIFMVIKGKQKTLMGLYILRYDNSDEFRDMTVSVRKKKLNEYIQSKIIKNKIKRGK